MRLLLTAASGSPSRALDRRAFKRIAVLGMTIVTDSPLSPRIARRPQVVVTRRLLPGVEARMAELFDVEFNTDDKRMTRDELIAAMQRCDVLVPNVADVIDGDMIATAGERLGLIANFGAGIEHIDLAAARARKIIVTNTPGVFTEDTADLAMALIIAVPRQLARGIRVLLGGEWQGWGPSNLLGHRLGGRTLGIVGMGRIGQAVARRARAFGLEIAYHNRHRLAPEAETLLNAQYEADLDALVARADILSLHCPATAKTHHILNAERLALMKPDAYVINTARGELIDEEALIAALESGKLAGAGLDVFAREPAVDPRLLALPNVVAIPHLGSATVEGRSASGEKIIANIRFWADGHRPPDQVIDGWA